MQQDQKRAGAAPEGGALEIKSLLARFRTGWVSVAAFSVAANLLMLAPSLYMLQVYDRVLASGNVFTLVMLSLMIVGLLALMGALDYARSAVIIQIGARFDAALAGRVHEAAFQRGLAGVPANAGQAVSDLNTVRQFLTGSAVFAFFDAPWFPLFLLVMFLFHPWVGTLALAGAVALVALAWLNEQVSRKLLAEAGGLSVRAGVEADGQLRNAEAIQAMGMLARLRARWQRLHVGYVRRQGLASRRSAMIASMSKTVRLALQSLVLGLGAWLVLQSHVSAGMMIAGSILMGRVLSPIDQVIGAWRQWTGTRLAWRRLQTLLETYPGQPAGLALPEPTGALRLEGATVTPPGAAQPTLVNVSLALAPGQVLGVIGPSGAGKSTLARLVAGVWPARLGAVRLDGADLRQWERTRLGEWLGYVPQDVELFSGTVAENIARFPDPDSDGEELARRVIEAARLAGAHDMILALPRGYDTLLGAGGQGLSGGQRQRIALARALYGTPRLVVLDEPNASLDDAGEQALLDALGRLREIGATVVLVTHRPKVLAATTHLLLLRDGRAQRFGATSEVLRPPPAGATGAEGAAAPRPATFDAKADPGQPAQAPGMAGATGAGGAVPASSVRTPASVAQVYPLAGGAFPGQFSGGKA
ncbi:type I secretion system permease/ATPase [Achromobacter ruhlandii]|uniref:type I secretion system permease/ATPase n=1 Tax=Achromobacter ruhlandii TaxID=72557 RepID=UPI0006C4F7DA|nr:type I secretion system permease/ATPase [Achromobacter ruhlandii]AVC42622.1 type I secretion system permease/ATPase [Achromobacter xylosoxidans]CUI26545.1 Type I secretion system ATP-binding protein PrsD [Achromobacter ruhlandii]CUI39631.1 Type I secretion system ATP-binding protein PrsD [Achromobacter ruhlandii]CUJ94320.1 Type I secretion system ATP-binding protein PrsD [Achromobacter ruhlandii]